MRIDQLGEDRLIRLIQRTVKTRGRVKVGIGDDGCVLKDGTVVTTDAYAEGVHFDLGYMSYDQVGVRCACAALSDIVAMGAQPQLVLVALAVPGHTTSAQVRSLYQGIERVCGQLGCAVGGGDIIRFDRLVLVLTATGKTRRPKLRSAARPLDQLYVTGYLGLAETGRRALQHRLPAAQFALAIRRHLEPLPRLKVMQRLRPQVHALIDTSDGLATDARHLGALSRVRIVLWPDRFPIHPSTHELCRLMGLDPVKFALTSGEDYELLFTSGHNVASTIDQTAVTGIGRVTAGSGLFLERAGKLESVLETGYDHLSAGQ